MARVILKKSTRRETNKFARNEELGMKVPIVTWVRPETERSNLGQDEAKVILRGGLKRFYEQVFF